MEPKDLKNSEELNDTTKPDLENSEKSDSGSGKPVDSTENKEKEKTEKPETNPKKDKIVIEKETVSAPEKETSKDDLKAEPEKIKEKKKSPKVKEEKETVKEKKSKKKAEEEVAENKAESETKEVTDSKVEAEKVKEVTEKPVEKISEEVSNEKLVEKETVEDIKPPDAEKPEEKQPKQPEKTEEKAVSETNDQPEKETVAAAEKPVVERKKKPEGIDYSNYSQVELINALRDVLDNPDDYDLKSEIDAIRSAFYKKRNDNIEEAKKAFIDDGGMEEEFEAEPDPYENDIKDLLKRYRQIRIDYNKRLDVEKEENLKKKYEVIEKIKGLINNEESINKTFNEFRDLQREWHDIGLVPQSKMKNLWDLYHFHVENFYDYIKINRELRDLDLKKNLEMKIGLCEHAEELLLESSVIKAFNMLQKYHEQWREIGPVPRENKDDIWERFKSVTAKINKKHQEFFEDRKSEQKKNLEAKTALCEKAEEISTTELASYKDWDEKSKELIELQKVWRTIGFAPKKDNNKIYDRFRTACDSFFNAKRDFYSKNKEIQQNNLQLKIDLCVQAEELKDSTDWKKTTQDFINIQKQWKEIGPVPRKHSDALWKRFRTACDFFFDKKSEHFSDMDSEQIDNLKAKEDLVAEVENFKSAGDVDKNLKTLKEFQRRWTEIGHVPFKKKDELQNKFREAINKLYDNLNIDEEKRNLLKFKNKMSSYSESNRGQNKMRMEREKYMNKLKQLENDLVLLDNNIGFFAKSKNAESLIKDVKKKIEVTKQKIELLKEKIRVIDSMEN